MKVILALDLGTQGGWAVRKDSGRVESGSESFACRKHEPVGMRWARFRAFLVDTKAANPDLAMVIFEDVKRHLGTESAHCFGAFRALTELFTAHHNLELRAIGVGTWKKHFTGNGAAKKEQIIDVCKSLGYQPKDSNEADAIGILHVATGTCPILNNSPAPKKPTRLKQAGTLAAQPF